MGMSYDTPRMASQHEHKQGNAPRILSVKRNSVPMAIAATNPINNKGWDRDQGKAQRISTANIVSWQLPNSKSNDPKREQQKRRSNSTWETFNKQTTFTVRDPLL